MIITCRRCGATVERTEWGRGSNYTYESNFDLKCAHKQQELQEKGKTNIDQECPDMTAAIERAVGHKVK